MERPAHLRSGRVGGNPLATPELTIYNLKIAKAPLPHNPIPYPRNNATTHPENPAVSKARFIK